MLEIGSIVWGVRDIQKFTQVLHFWCEALDYEPAREPGHDFAIIIPKNGKAGQRMSIDVVSPLDGGSHNRTRHHLDLYASDQAAEIERLLALGATRPARSYPDDADYIILEDPDGNAFCVIDKGE